jgi:Transposase IS66 family/zinc-finger binding domain of transposase IS66
MSKWNISVRLSTHVYELPAEQRRCSCCGEQRQEIGSEESWQIEYLPGHFERLRHVRKKYACAKCELAGENPQIATAAKAETAIEKGFAGPGLLAYIVTSKFADYLPLYRLEDSSPRYTHMRVDCVCPGPSIGKTVSSVATTWDCLTRSAIRRYSGSTRSATSPHHTDCVAREIAKPCRSKMNYTLSQWEELTVFTSDGAVPIDNNVSEREMKRVVLNRKNSLFVGNPRGGRTAAILASLTSSCRRHEMDPQLYFMQLLMNLPLLAGK